MRPLLANAAVKAALVGLLVFAVARPDLPQFSGKAMLGMTGTCVATALTAWIRMRQR